MFAIVILASPLSLSAEMGPHAEGEKNFNRPPVEYFRGRVLEIVKEGEEKIEGITDPQPYQTIKIRLESGPEKGTEVEINYGGEYTISKEQKVRQGETIVVAKLEGLEKEINYYVVDKYRLPALALIAAIFFLAAIALGRLKGATSLLGLGISLLVLVKFMLPRIVRGENPLLVALVGALVIALVSLYLAHGFNKKTTLALGSTLFTLGLAVGLAMFFVWLAKLTGLGTDEAFFVQAGPLAALNLKGLLLGGMLVGALGVLDDITTGQTAAIAEIKNANPELSWRQLYKSGLNVGREHIASLVNTLVLAYAGASFPLLLLFTTTTEVPFWVTANGEFLAEEIVRTLVGSSALLLAVPISTFLAAYVFGKHDVNH